MKMFPGRKSKGENRAAVGIVANVMPERISSKRLKIIISVLLIATVGVASWIIIDQRKSGPAIVKDPRLERIENTPEPADPEQKAIHYMQLAETYALNGDYQKALDTMLKADSYIVNRSPNGGYSTNIMVAKYHEKLGNKIEARKAYQREIDRIAGHPGSEEAVDAIKKLRDAL